MSDLPPPPPSALARDLPPPRPSTPPRRLAGRFWCFLTAIGISGLGDGLVFVAFPLLAASETGDARLVALVTVASRLPWLLVSLPIGAIADRMDRRRLLVVVELGRAAILVGFGLLILTDRWSFPTLLVTVFLIGVGETAFFAASHAALPTLVPMAGLGRANGYISSVETTTMEMIGPAIGAITIAAAASLPFLADGVSYALCAVLMAVALPAGHRTETAAPTRLRDDVRAGFAYFRRQPALRSLALVISSLAFCQAVIAGVLVLYATRTLGLSGLVYALLLALAAIVNVLGSLAAGHLDERHGPQRLIPAAALVATIGYLVIAVAPNVAVAAIGLCLEAAAVAFGNVSSIAYRQRTIPSELLGRVGNLFRFFIFGVIPIGALVGGFLGQAVGLRAPFLVAAAVQLVAMLAFCPTMIRRMAPGGAPDGIKQPA